MEYREKLSFGAQEIMNERFGHDILIGLATIDDNIPNIRAVNAYCENGAFYVIAYGLIWG